MLAGQSKADSGTLTPIHAFKGPDGAELYGSATQAGVALTVGKNGVLFGTTFQGGPTNRGTVFSLTPPAAVGQAWTHAIIHNFSGKIDGSVPGGGVAIATDGALYGFTQNPGTVYAIKPPSTPGGIRSESVIYVFGNDDLVPGNQPMGTPLLIGKSIYGVTTLCSYSAFTVCGGVFRMDPPSSPGGAWNVSTIWTFRYPANTKSRAPTGYLIAGPGGRLYGTLSGGFGANAGIFELTPPPSASKAWTYTEIYRFQTKDSDGAHLAGPIAIDRAGAIYGTTQNTGASQLGEVFKLSPPASAGKSWTKMSSDAPFVALGQKASGGAVLDDKGRIYSFAQRGGECSCGTIIRIVPPASVGGAWQSTIVHQFQGGADGAIPLSLTAVSGSTTLYGITQLGGSGADDPAGAEGAYGWGAVFQLKP